MSKRLGKANPSPALPFSKGGSQNQPPLKKGVAEGGGICSFEKGGRPRRGDLLV
jgi:hypothetical protein